MARIWWTGTAALLMIFAPIIVAYVALYEVSSDEKLVIAASSQSGDSYALALAIAEVIRQQSPNVTIEVLETRGSSQNVQLLEAGRVDLALVQADVQAPKSARLVAPLFQDHYQLIVRADSTIHHVEDLRGRVIALPPKGSGQSNSFWLMADHYGLKEADVDDMPVTEKTANWALTEGVADAIFRVRAPGNPALRQLVSEHAVRFVPIDQAAAMQLAEPSLKPGHLVKGAFRGYPPIPEQELATATVDRLLLAHKDADADVVHQVTEVLFEHRQALVNKTPLASYIVQPDVSKGTSLPVHSGARRYYDREKPSFLQRHARLMTFIVVVLTTIGSGIMTLRAKWVQKKKNRADTHINELLQISQEARTTLTSQTRRQYQQRVLEILNSAMRDLDNDLMSPDGFNAFSFTWEAVNASLLNSPQLSESGLQRSERAIESEEVQRD